jgi:hypothetical protein
LTATIQLPRLHYNHLDDTHSAADARGRKAVPISITLARKETTMGYNRAGYRVKKSERRRRKEQRRLASKAAPQEGTGVAGSVKRAVKHVAEAVGEGVAKVVEKVTGKGKAQKE